MSLNKVILLGRLGRDPETKALQGGVLCNFSVATSETFKGRDGEKQEKTEWHNIVAFGKLAEICAQHLQKGSQVLVEGKLQTRSWEDTEGRKHYRTEIVANRVEFLSSRSAETTPSFNEMDDIPF